MDGYGGVGGAEASGVEGVAVVVGGADPPIPSHQVEVADAACWVVVWGCLGLHEGICAVWEDVCFALAFSGRWGCGCMGGVSGVGVVAGFRRTWVGGLSNADPSEVVVVMVVGWLEVGCWVWVGVAELGGEGQAW